MSQHLLARQRAPDLLNGSLYSPWQRKYAAFNAGAEPLHPQPTLHPGDPAAGPHTDSIIGVTYMQRDLYASIYGRFLLHGPSYMHSCRVFTLALARLYCKIWDIGCCEISSVSFRRIPFYGITKYTVSQKKHVTTFSTITLTISVRLL